MNIRQVLTERYGEAGLRAVVEDVATNLVKRTQEGDRDAARTLAEHLSPPESENSGLAERMKAAQARIEDPKHVAAMFRTLWTGTTDAGRSEIVRVAREIRMPTIAVRTGTAPLQEPVQPPPPVFQLGGDAPLREDLPQESP